MRDGNTGSQPFPSLHLRPLTSKLVRSLGPQPLRLQCYSERMTGSCPLLIQTPSRSEFSCPLTKEPGLMFESPIPPATASKRLPHPVVTLRFSGDVFCPGERIMDFQCPYSRHPHGKRRPHGPTVPHGQPGSQPTSSLTVVCQASLGRVTTLTPLCLQRARLLTNPPLSPALLAAPGHPSCTPQRVTADYALFLIQWTAAGRSGWWVIGKTVIYILEIVNKVESITLDYGTITRDSPARILVEFRYSPAPLVVTAGYMTKIPSLGPGLPGQDVFGVQRSDVRKQLPRPVPRAPAHAAEAAPLPGGPSGQPSDLQWCCWCITYCVAYPRSGATMWVLLYKECPNPLDPPPHNAVLPSPESQTRRFTITTFQFLQKGKTYDLDQEVYFMCSTEACVPQDGPCLEGCLDQ
ncbi:unnamed protein product [Boreogadus saida]